MLIDLSRADYSHCEHAPEALPASMRALLDQLVTRVVGAPTRITRLVSYLQGAVTLLDHHHEFRIHAWVQLPDAHPSFPEADRGLACILRPVDVDGLTGAMHAGVGWLGRPLGPWLRLQDGDWVSDMIRDQGYMSIAGAEWTEPLEDVTGQALLGWFLGRHLDGMTNHVILEERLLRRG